MEQMLHSAGALLIQALPTFFVVVLLHWYLKSTLFQPLEKVLEERHAETQGAREKAAAALAAAETKVAEYDLKLRAARTEIYQEQETWRKQLLDEQTAAVTKAREESHAQIVAAKADISAQVDQARATLTREAEALADQVVAGIMKGSRN
ncbi:MAG: ATP synthase F0 subunit B [Acidobacteria bacterium]|nr:ATP synthase F0 subunit B [Acidobacteriota bacterium]